MPPDENASVQLRFDILQTPIQVLLRVSQEGEILEQVPNAAEWPPECRPMGLMVERLQSALSAAIAEAGEMRKYASHLHGCHRRIEPMGICSCGLDSLLAKSLEAAGS